MILDKIAVTPFVFKGRLELAFAQDAARYFGHGMAARRRTPPQAMITALAPDGRWVSGKVLLHNVSYDNATQTLTFETGGGGGSSGRHLLQDSLSACGGGCTSGTVYASCYSAGTVRALVSESSHGAGRGCVCRSQRMRQVAGGVVARLHGCGLSASS